MNKRLLFQVVFVLLVSVSLLAAQNAKCADFCTNPKLEKQPVLAEGRAMPLGIYAEKVRKNVFSGDACKSLTATALYCYLSMGEQDLVESRYGCPLRLKAEHKATFELLGLPGRGSPIPVELALSQRENLISAYHALESKGEGSSGAANDLSNLLMHLVKYETIATGNDWNVLIAGHKWKTLGALKAGLPEPFLAPTVLSGTEQLTGEERQGMRLESLYDATKPFVVAIFIAALGLMASLAASRSEVFVWLSTGCLALLALTEVSGIVLRVMISGRGPVTNMFETVMWVGCVVLALATILGIKLKNRQIWAIGFAGNTITLFMLNFATKMLTSDIQPLVPVLRDNFWLSTHVTAVTSSYACFTFAWLIANYALLRRLFGDSSKALTEKWNYVARAAIQIGCVFLAGGVILGGVWADYSWGRFWGWDPKETWSLIALIVYIGILHGRYAGWFTGLQFTIAAALGYLSIIMAWFGVNYILAVGLHSYGFSSGGALFISVVVAVQLGVVGATVANERR